MNDVYAPAFMEAGFVLTLDNGYLKAECLTHGKAFVITPITSAEHAVDILTHVACTMPNGTARPGRTAQ